MIEEILTASGVPFREGQFLRPPAKTYAVYMDDVTADGPDDAVRILYHAATVELYEPKPDPEAEKAVEAQLNARGLKWSKQSRYWLEAAQRHQVVYEFEYTKKL